MLAAKYGTGWWDHFRSQARYLNNVIEEVQVFGPYDSMLANNRIVSGCAPRGQNQRELREVVEARCV